MGGLFQINPVTKTGQRLYMVSTLAKVFTVHHLASAPGAHAATSLPPDHRPHHPEQHHPQRAAPVPDGGPEDWGQGEAGVQSRRVYSPHVEGGVRHVPGAVHHQHAEGAVGGCFPHLHKWHPHSGTEPDGEIQDYGRG